MTRVATMLEQAREDRGLSRNKAAKELETTVLTYRQWIRGQRPGPDKAGKLAEFVGLDKKAFAAAYVKDVEEELNLAMGVYVSSNFHRAAKSQLAA